MDWVSKILADIFIFGLISIGLIIGLSHPRMFINKMLGWEGSIGVVVYSSEYSSNPFTDAKYEVGYSFDVNSVQYNGSDIRESDYKEGQYINIRYNPENPVENCIGW